jgi:putative component of membrane protein insertase Oxa1/YidC/SpoIIIJ protein YidD
LLPLCSEYLRELYTRAGALNGARWLMIRVTDPRILADVKSLIRLRVMPKA